MFTIYLQTFGHHSKHLILDLSMGHPSFFLSAIHLKLPYFGLTRDSKPADYRDAVYTVVTKGLDTKTVIDWLLIQKQCTTSSPKKDKSISSSQQSNEKQEDGKEEEGSEEEEEEESESDDHITSPPANKKQKTQK
jgi:hypothetical protein